MQAGEGALPQGLVGWTLERFSLSGAPPGVGACTSTGISCAEEEPAWLTANGYIT